jgi:Txe/YoeB family toxin of Txe-Axe toxin-antitoxin module
VKSRTTKRFRDDYRALPPNIRERAREAYKRFMLDPYHNSLNFEKLEGRRENLWSARINDNYRAIGIRRGDEITWIGIGKHDIYNRM